MLLLVYFIYIFRNEPLAMEAGATIVALKVLSLILLFYFSHSQSRQDTLETCTPQTRLHLSERRWMSTKTGYRQLVAELHSSDNYHAPNCTTVHLWTIIRHGTRYPSKDAIRLMTENLPKLRDEILKIENSPMCENELDLLRNWKSDVELDNSKNLHVVGDDEMVLLGERWLNRYPDLLGSYDETKFRFRSTETERSKRSGDGVITGLWSRILVPKVKWNIIKTGHDPLIRFYKVCDAWIRDVKKNKNAIKERALFEESLTMKDTIESVSKYVGLNLTLSDVDMMYVTCNFDLAWSRDHVSPWCQVFSDLDLKVMEYREDLEYYWLDGPGHSINSQPACVLMEDVIKTFNDISAGDTQKGTFYFTHSGTILKLLTHLNLYNDVEPLKSNNFETMKNRNWKTSKFGAFGANVAFSLQQCVNKELKVGLFVNEKLTKIPGCEDNWWCSLNTFKRIFDRTNGCNLTEICSISSNIDQVDEMDVPDDKY